MKKYWYKTFTTECPICGRGETIRERQYTEAPEKDDYMARYEYSHHYDYCDV